MLNHVKLNFSNVNYSMENKISNNAYKIIHLKAYESDIFQKNM